MSKRGIVSHEMSLIRMHASVEIPPTPPGGGGRFFTVREKPERRFPILFPFRMDFAVSEALQYFQGV